MAKKQVNTLRIRNPLFNHPLMKKGGVHNKSNKSKRQVNKNKLRKEWYY